MTYSLSALLVAEADVPVNLAMSGLLVAFSKFMAAAITGGGAAMVCKDSILKNSIKCQLLINQCPIAHQRILNVLLLGLDSVLIIVFVKTTRKRFRYYRRFFKKSYNISKNIRSTANKITISREKRRKSIFNLLFLIFGIFVWVLNPWPFQNFMNDSAIE